MLRPAVRCPVCWGLLALLAVARPGPAAEPDDLYDWRPVRLGAGGFVTGFVTHPKDAAVRYCRTDVGNAYRWDGTEWRPMVVRTASGGFPADVAATPAVLGVDSLALDPTDPKVVYLTAAFSRSADVTPKPPSAGNVYRSTDGGRSFVAGGLNVRMEPNGPWRAFGERLKVDPNNPAVLDYGSVADGLWRSLDGGRRWQPVRGGPGDKANVLAVHFAAGKATADAGGVAVSRTSFAVVGDGSVYQSADGGATWRNISAGTELDGKCQSSVTDPAGTLHVVQKDSQRYWSWSGAKWATRTVGFDYAHHLGGVAFDPKNPRRVYAVTVGGGLAASADGGATWAKLGPELRYANTLGWLPQVPSWRSNAGLTFDADGTLWLPQGNEGVLRHRPSAGDKSPPKWTIDSVGIEEFVTHDVLLPPKGPAVFAVEDATGLVSADLGKFVARQIPLQDQLISNGTGLAYCPNAPEFVAVVTADVHHTGSGKSYSGYSADGGKTWKRFGSVPPNAGAGSVAVSRRGGWGLGADHLVWLPSGGGVPHYSHDGGKTWAAGAGFPDKDGFWNAALKQRQLAADPFVPDRFYLVGSWRGGFYVSTDGGKSWAVEGKAGLPKFNHHGQLATNPAVPGDLWFCDGWEGADRHGVWHSTDGGKSFAPVAGFEHAVTLAVGKGAGRTGDAAYAVYVYGKRAGTADWGVFRSTDAGASWRRVGYYPAGLFDQPTCMAASWDEFGTVVIGFGGNSFVVGTPARR